MKKVKTQSRFGAFKLSYGDQSLLLVSVFICLLIITMKFLSSKWETHWENLVASLQLGPLIIKF